MPCIYRFGEFHLNPAIRELRHGDEILSLRRKAFDCLVYLVEHRDRVVKRDELIEAVWRTVHLSDSVLAQTILDVRRALEDHDEASEYVKTVRGLGYRWAVPVEMAAETDSEVRREPVRLWVLLLFLSAGVLSAGMLLVWITGDRGEFAAPVAPVDEGEIGLVLPVTVDADAHETWLRLGLMEFITEHLRAGDQPMVPTDTVIALLRGVSKDVDTEDLEHLSMATGARLVLRAHAQFKDRHWRVSLRSLQGTQVSLSTLGEAEDVLEAARVASDRMLLSLGRPPAPVPPVCGDASREHVSLEGEIRSSSIACPEPGVELLLQQTEAAILAEQHDVARALIQAADEALRRQPEIRWQLARIELHSLNLVSAREMLESVLAEPRVEQEPILKAKILHDLSRVYYQYGDFGATQTILEEVILLLEQRDALDVLGRVQRSLGLVKLMSGQLDEAGVYLARARRALEGTGDAMGLATLDNNLGLLEALRERYTEARLYFESAANRDAALHHVSSELNNRANVIEAHLGLLELEAAMAIKPRLNELLDQTDNPDTVAQAKLAKVYLLAAAGQLQAAENDLTELLSDVGGDEESNLHLSRTRALLLRAQWAGYEGDMARSARVAAGVVERLPADSALMAEERGRAWLTLIRAQLVLDHREAAAGAVTAMAAWAERSATLPPKIYAALAEAELAAADGRPGAAGNAFEHALALADTSHVPQRVVQVAKSYIPWLLMEAPQGIADPDRALVVAGRVNAYADRDYDAALVQVRVYHAVGPASAWRTALSHARSLAGEREIPPELQVVPD